MEALDPYQYKFISHIFTALINNGQTYQNLSMYLGELTYVIDNAAKIDLNFLLDMKSLSR